MIQFTHPIYLLLFIPVGVFLWKTVKASLADISGVRRTLALAFRVAIISMVILAIAGMQFVRSTKHLAAVYVLDVSDSIPKEKVQSALDYVNRSLKAMKDDDYAGMVVFGTDASMELVPSPAVKKISRIYSVPTSSYTDIAQALGLAMASFPQGCAKRIVLLTDGNENLGKALDQAYLAQSNEVTIDVVPLSNKLEQEALLDKLITPSEVKIGEPFDLKLVAVSEKETTAAVKLMRNGESVGQKIVMLSPGKNVLTFTQSIPKAGSYRFEALLDAESDTLSENNRALAATIVRGKPKVLYIEGKPGEGTHLKKALAAQHIDVETKGPDAIPTQLTEFADYDSMILCDVPATAMSPEQMKMVQSGVRDLGIGLGMIGGEDSFGAGGYFDTPIEKTLPVDMSVRKQKVFPSMTVYIVIDKSGSMGEMQNGVEKIRLAAEAAIAVTETLQDEDMIGVIATASDPETLSPIRPARLRKAIVSDISTLRAGDYGIFCFRSLKRAEEDLKNVKTRIKHVIFLADGNHCVEQDGCVELAQKMFKKHRITISAVAIGNGVEVPFLQSMAKAGGGGFYLTERARDLPRIFTKDALLASKSLIVEEPFKPKIDASADVMGGIDWKSEPPLLGYVSTSPKNMAEVLMTSHKDDPVYAQWRYGLGHAIAFTSDAKPMWAAHWVGWDGFGKFWAQAIRWSMRKTNKTDFQTTLDIKQGVGKVTVDAVTEKGEFLNGLDLAATVVSPDMKSRKLDLSQVAPGKYEADFSGRQVGSYVVNVVQTMEGGRTAAQTSALVIPYPPEYKDIRPNNFLLNQIARTSGGRMNPQADSIFRHPPKGARVPTDLWKAFALLCALLLPLDVAVRRLNITITDASGILAAVQARIKPKRSKSIKHTEQVATLGTLKSSQKVRKEEINADREEVLRKIKEVSEQPTVQSQPITQQPAPKQEEKAAQKPEPKEEPKPAAEEDSMSRLLETKRRLRKKD